MGILYLFIVLCVLATVTALGAGIVSMVQGGQEDQARSHKFMFGRVALQGLAVLFVLLAVLSQVR
jgi:hypothetical protein